MSRNDRWETAKLRRLQARRERLGLSPDPLSRLAKMRDELEKMEQERGSCKGSHQHEHPHPEFIALGPLKRTS